MEYEVLARPEHDAPMRRVGTIDAQSADMAQTTAWEIYDGFEHVEMWVVPRDAFIRAEGSRINLAEGILEADIDPDIEQGGSEA